MSPLFRQLLFLQLQLQLRSRTLVLLLLTPILGGVGLAVFGSEVTTDTLALDLPTEERDRPALPVAIPELFVSPVEASDRLTVAATSATGFDEVPAGAVAAVGPGETGWSVRWNGSKGRKAALQLEAVLEKEARRSWRDDWSLTSSVDPVTLVQYRVQEVEPAPSEIPPTALLAFLLVGVLGLNTFGASTHAYTTARQKKTRQTLSLVPATPAQLHGAKALVVLLLGCANGALAVLAWLGASWVSHGVVPLGPLALLGLTIALCALAVQFTGAWCAVSAWAPDRRTSSFVGSFVLTAALAAAIAVFLPDPPLALALLPFSGAAVAVREACDAGNPAFLGICLLSTTGWAWATSRAAVTLWDREHGEIRKRGPRQALALYTIAMLLVWFLGQAATAIDLVGGLLFLQIGLIATSAFSGVSWLGRPLRSTLSLQPPRATDALAGLLLGCAMPLVGLAVMWLQGPLIPTPEDWGRSFSSQLLGSRPLWANLLLIAVLPGICEELLFRGALLGLARDGLPDGVAVAVVAVAFGILHLDAPRLLPTATLGVVLGLLVLRTNSLVPAILAHMANNAVALGLSALDDPDAAVFGASGAAGLAAVALLGRRR